MEPALAALPLRARDAARTPAAGTAAAGRRRLGAGRSGVVFEEVTPAGERLACKVFVPDTASSLVMGLLTGAPNPYRWSRRAVEVAVLRRRIVARLVDYWLDGRVRLPRTEGMRWCEEERAFELRAELIEGRHARLRLPGDRTGEAAELARDVLVPLQAHLAAAGLDGLLWQAGLGNPVAAANFMRATSLDAKARWVWIDLESGVPALFPLNPWRLLTHYLPLSLKHGRWLFDDVDTDRLATYLAEHEAALRLRLGPRGWRALREQAAQLGVQQRRWKSLGRTQRGVASALSRGRINREQARHYWRRPGAWLRWTLGRGLLRLPSRLGPPIGRALSALAPRPLLAAVGRWGRFFLSQEVRARWAHGTMRRRVLDWRGRGFLDRAAASDVRESMTRGDAVEYVADFGVHLAIKPGLKLLQWGLVPALFATGVIHSGWLTALLVLGGGALGRTAYTLGRSVQAAWRGRPVPWVALSVGLLPVVGNAAYPLQLLAATTHEKDEAARFLVHDFFSALGRRVPIWGGRDSRLEHWGNALAGLITRA